jgi:hypothetical protein
MTEVKAGAIALAAIAIVSAAGLFGPSLLAPERRAYRIRVGADEDLTGLKAGTPVFLAGVPMGEVLRVIDDRMEDGTPSYVVELEVEARPPLYPGAMARIEGDPVSQRARIEFISAGEPGASREPLENGLFVFHAPPVGAEGILSPQLDADIQAIRTRVGIFSEGLPAMRASGPSFRALATDFTALRERIETDAPNLRERFDVTAARYRDVADRFREFNARVADLREAFAAVRALFGAESAWSRIEADARAAIDAWRATSPDRDAIVASARDIGEAATRIRERGQLVLRSFSAMLEEIRADAGLPAVQADLALAATNFIKLQAGVSANPLSALIPGDSSLDRRSDALDDLARRLLLAAEDARATEEGIRRLGDAWATGLRAGELLERIEASVRELESLEAALGRSRPAGPAP